MALAGRMSAQPAANNVARVRITPWLVAAMGLFTSTLAIAQTSAAKPAPLIDDEAYTHPQRMVRIERGRRLNLYCVGKGSPTVVFDSAVGGDSSDWGLVQPKIAPSTRACSYDRAGIGFSDAAKRASSSINIVDDLHRLLVAAHIGPPYVMVGHSYGTLNVQLFAARFPAEVAGMVLVDPQPQEWINDIKRLLPHWQTDEFEPMIARQRTCVAASLAGFKPGTDLYKKCVDWSDPRFSDSINAAHLRIYSRPAYQRALLSEDENVYGGISEDQVRDGRKGFGAMPLIVLTRSPNTSPLAPNETAESRDAIYQAWVQRENEIASLSSRGVNKVIPDTGHFIQLQQPAAVIDAIDQILNATPDPAPR